MMNELLKNTLYGDPLNIIINSLPMTDVYNLSLTCKLLHNKLQIKLKQRFRNNICDRLKCIFGQHYDDFVKQMVVHEASIFGSFLIECLLEENFEYSDIDIFIGDYNKYNSFLDYMTHIYGKYDMNSAYGNSAANFVINDKVIQFVYREKEQQFDMDICNGKVSFNDGLIVINKLQYNSIFSKVGIINNEEYDRTTINRIYKYAGRGFTFISDVDVKANIEYEIIMGKLYDDKHLYLCADIPTTVWLPFVGADLGLPQTFNHNGSSYLVKECSYPCMICMFLDIDHLCCVRNGYIDELIILVSNIVNFDDCNPHILYPELEIHDDGVLFETRKYYYLDDIVREHFDYIDSNTSLAQFNDYLVKKNNNDCNIIPRSLV